MTRQTIADAIAAVVIITLPIWATWLFTLCAWIKHSGAGQ
jgi:hypothetical protein